MNYDTIPTQVGAAKLRNASLLGQTVTITRVVFGDGGGAEYSPTGLETELKNQVYETQPARIEEEGETPNWIELEALIPHNVGGWYLREMGCYDEDGDLIFIGNLPSSFKPSGEAGVIKDLVFEMVYDAVAADVVQIKIDPNVVIATRKYVDDKDKAHADSDDPHPQYATDTDISNLVAISQFLPFDSSRTYKTGETCTTESNGEVQVWQMYAGPNLTCKGKDPTNPLNRHEQWANAPEPWWWVPYTGNTPGQMSGWLSDTIPEEAVLENEVDLNAKMYWRLAARWPELVSGVGDAAVINTRDILGRYVRTADGASYLLNQTHEDAIRNITGGTRSVYASNTVSNGALSLNIYGNSPAKLGTIGGDPGANFTVGFDASLVVPTANQNQPVTTIENKIVFV